MKGPDVGTHNSSVWGMVSSSLYLEWKVLGAHGGRGAAGEAAGRAKNAVFQGLVKVPLTLG